MNEWLAHLKVASRWGVYPGNKEEINRRIEFSNVVFIALPVIYLVFMAIDFRSYLKPMGQWRIDEWMVPFLVLFCVAALLVNKAGYTTASRVGFILLWPGLVHLWPIIRLQTPIDYYLAYPFGIVFHGILTQFFFSPRREKFLFWSIMTANGAAMLLAPQTLATFDTDGDIPALLVNNEYFFYDGILYWLLFNLVTFYVVQIVESYIRDLRQSNAMVLQQKDELNMLNRRLEEKVRERTAVLELQNEKLAQHAYFNAHLLRGPFCRVKGLLVLLDMRHDPGETDVIKQRLTSSITELDVRIREIQRLVESDLAEADAE